MMQWLKFLVSRKKTAFVLISYLVTAVSGAQPLIAIEHDHLSAKIKLSEVFEFPTNEEMIEISSGQEVETVDEAYFFGKIGSGYQPIYENDLHLMVHFDHAVRSFTISVDQFKLMQVSYCQPINFKTN